MLGLCLISLVFCGDQADAELESTGRTSESNRTADWYVDQSLSHFQKGQFAECIAACVKALELDPANAIAYNNMCAAYNRLEAWDKAIEACEKSLVLAPSFELARNNLKQAQEQKREK